MIRLGIRFRLVVRFEHMHGAFWKRKILNLKVCFFFSLLALFWEICDLWKNLKFSCVWSLFYFEVVLVWCHLCIVVRASFMVMVAWHHRWLLLLFVFPSWLWLLNAIANCCWCWCFLYGHDHLAPLLVVVVVCAPFVVMVI